MTQPSSPCDVRTSASAGAGISRREACPSPVVAGSPRVATVRDIRRAALQVACTADSITGSPPYWWGKRKEVEALVRYILAERDELPIAFVTVSMAEYHWPEVGASLCTRAPASDTCVRST
jgi:hypothetical protein